VGEIPLHPAIVHLPIALGLITPLLLVVVLIGQKKLTWHKTTWLLVILSNLLIATTAFFAERSGEEDYDRVEIVVGDEPVHEHEEWGEKVLVSALTALTLSVVAYFVSGFGLVYVTLAANLVVMFLVLQAGRTGGELIYIYGGAAAHAPSPAGLQLIPEEMPTLDLENIEKELDALPEIDTLETDQ